MIVDNAKVVIDTRNVCHKAGLDSARIIKA
jgi:hypothetical protein